MMDLFERADPARGHEADFVRLRAKIDQRIGISPSALERRALRPAVVAVGAFVLVLVIAMPALLRRDTTSVFAPQAGGLGDLPGIEAIVPLASGGVQTMAVGGDTIWVMTSLQNTLQRVSARTGRLESSYAIDRYAEGVVVGGGYVWLRSYDNGGEVLRFNPDIGEVDKVVPAGEPGFGIIWFADSLWVANTRGEILRISVDGAVVATLDGGLKGEGLGYLWVSDPTTGVVSSLGESGARGEIVIPGDGISAESGIREIAEAGGYLWLMEGGFPNGSSVTRFDPATGELQSIPIAPGLLSMVEFDGSLWITSHTDHLLVKVDPSTGELHRYPMPGKAGGVLVADGSLWVALYHPGVLVRVDAGADLIEEGEIVVDAVENGHRLLCTTGADPSGPTILLEPMDWIDYGSWSVIQAQISDQGHLVCADGYLTGSPQSFLSPGERAADLEEALVAAAIPGPYVLVASGDGVHAARVFADGRDDIAGVVLVDPMPLGFQRFLDGLLGEGGHPPWLDLDPEVSSALSRLGDAPLVVIGQDPDAVYLSRPFVDAYGSDTANQVNDYWQDGLVFYAGLSTDSQSLVAKGAGLEYVLWSDPSLVVEEVLDVLARTEARP